MKNSFESQEMRLLKALRQRPMTTGEIRAELGIGMPATRVFRLKQRGCVIDREMITVYTRHGNSQVARYTLVSEPGQQRRAAA